MDTQDLSVPPHAQSRLGGDEHPNRRPRRHSGGVIHDNTRHTSCFTVVGNHLAQHPELSGLAIGIGVHIQSLPTGAPVDIKTLAARFPEGATRIAAVLHELEAHGYLRRTRERLSCGRIVTRTVSCNQPGARRDGEDEPASPATAPPAPKPKKKAPRKPLPAVPQPVHPVPTLVQKATDLLADLRNYDSCLLLSACDIAHLAPGVAAWLERDVLPSVLRRALISDLPPEGPRRPAALLAHRLAVQLPPWPPFGRTTADAATSSPPDTRYGLVNCEGCDRAYRAPEPGLCRDCRTEVIAGAPLGGHHDSPSRTGTGRPARGPRGGRPGPSGGDAGNNGRGVRQGGRVAVPEPGTELGVHLGQGHRDRPAP